MERTLCSLLGGFGVAATEVRLEAERSSLVTCCCFTSRRDCSVETGREERGQRATKGGGC